MCTFFKIIIRLILMLAFKTLILSNFYMINFLDLSIYLLETLIASRDPIMISFKLLNILAHKIQFIIRVHIYWFESYYLR